LELHRFDAQNLANSLFSLAELEVESSPLHEDFFSKFSATCLDRLEGFREMDFSVMLYSIALLDSVGTKFDFVVPVKRLAERAVRSVDCLKHLSQLLIASVWFGTFEVPKSLIQRFRKVAEDGQGSSSELERRVSAVIEEEHTCVYLVEELLVRADIYLPKTNTIVKVDGVKHFRKDGKRTAKASLITKCLERLGYRVVRVGYQEVQDSELRSLMRRLLK
jgi:hypothetical protein